MASRSPSTTSGAGGPFVPEMIDANHPITKIPRILPHERVFPIQIGGELFKLSGASLSSDAPSYFSQYFRCQLARAEENAGDAGALKTLYIDRDPVTFRDIALHLQGYHVTPRDGTHFVRLFADAEFYSLPRLKAQLANESIFISIGHREFQIPRDIFSDPGNSPNYFSLGFAAFFSRPGDLFPGLEIEGLLRPPSILPPSVPNRSADNFAELVHFLRGYPVVVRDEAHRRDLLRDARYFHFKGLEQKLIAHKLSFNLARNKHEIVLRLENMQKSGVSIVRDNSTFPEGTGDEQITSGWVNYARPFVDNQPAELVLEIGGEMTQLHVSDNGSIARAQFFNDTRTRIVRLLEVLATKLNLPPTTQPLGLLMASGGVASHPATPGNTPLSEDLVRVVFENDAYVVLDGREFSFRSNPRASPDTPSDVETNTTTMMITPHNPRKRKRRSAGDGDEIWIVRTGQWRIRIQPSQSGKSAVECVLVAVKIDAMTSERSRNASRGFLDGESVS